MDAESAPLPEIRLTGFMHALAGCLGLAVLATRAWMALTRPAPPEPGVQTAAVSWHARVQEHVQVLAASPRSIATEGNAQARAYLVARTRYERGVSNYLDVTDAQRSSLAADRAAVQIKTQRLLATVAVARSLGAGWQPQGELAKVAAAQ